MLQDERRAGAARRRANRARPRAERNPQGCRAGAAHREAHAATVRGRDAGKRRSGTRSRRSRERRAARGSPPRLHGERAPADSRHDESLLRKASLQRVQTDQSHPVSRTTSMHGPGPTTGSSRNAWTGSVQPIGRRTGHRHRSSIRTLTHHGPPQASTPPCPLHEGDGDSMASPSGGRSAGSRWPRGAARAGLR